MSMNHSDPKIALVLADLTRLQRLLLVADGTLTKVLEVVLNEHMRVIKLHEEVTITTQSYADLALSAGEPIIQRQVLLQGQNSGTNWLYASSTIALAHLEPAFQQELLNSHMPIGKLWIAHRVETYKEIVSMQREPAGELASYFHIDADTSLLARTYRVFCHRQPVMQISEKFPDTYFKS
jgi:chorismate-pyruvate lyase